VPHEPVHGVRVQHFGAVLHLRPNAGFLLDQVQDQIELGGLIGHHRTSHGKPRELDFEGWRVLKGEHHLNQRGVVHRALGLNRFDQPLEGQVLVGEGAESDLANPVQQLPERGVAGQVGAHDQCVDEEPDQRQEAGVQAARDGRADHDIVAPRVPCEQKLEGAQHDHVQRGLLLAPECAQGAGKPEGKELPVSRSMPRLNRRSRPVGG
jgi:hypothetical protein